MAMREDNLSVTTIDDTAARGWGTMLIVARSAEPVKVGATRQRLAQIIVQRYWGAMRQYTTTPVDSSQIWI